MELTRSLKRRRSRSGTHTASGGIRRSAWEYIFLATKPYGSKQAHRTLAVSRQKVRHFAPLIFFFGGTDEEFNPFPRQTSVLIFYSAYAEGETLPLCPRANATLRLATRKANFMRTPLFALCVRLVLIPVRSTRKRKTGFTPVFSFSLFGLSVLSYRDNND